MTWLTDIGGYLQTQSIGTVGTDIFYGDFRAGVSNCISLSQSTGKSTKYTLRKTMKLERPQLIVRVRNQSGNAAYQKATSIYNLLSGVYNTVFGATRFKSIKDVAPPFFVSQSITEGTQYSIYFTLEIG